MTSASNNTASDIAKESSTLLDEVDRQIILATQEGLPFTPRPYHTVAEQLKLDPKEVMQRMQHMLDNGIIRRMGVIPNHYALGFRANGMSVWNVPDEKLHELGETIGQLDYVSHCYHRPRHLPEWPYNLFAMVHGRTREETDNKVQQIAQLLGDDNLGHTVLYSCRVLKKAGLRLS